jgi:hypothetical protein
MRVTDLVWKLPHFRRSFHFSPPAISSILWAPVDVLVTRLKCTYLAAFHIPRFAVFGLTSEWQR